MKAANPYYDVGFWEYVYAKEYKAYNTILAQKAKHLQALMNKDLFALAESEAQKTQRQILYLESELTQLYGFKLFTDEMRRCYIDSIDKIYNAYHITNLALEVENYQLRQELLLLNNCYITSIDETLFWIDYSIKATAHNTPNP